MSSAGADIPSIQKSIKEYTLKGRIAPYFSTEYPALLCHKVRGLESVSFQASLFRAR